MYEARGCGDPAVHVSTYVVLSERFAVQQCNTVYRGCGRLLAVGLLLLRRCSRRKWADRLFMEASGLHDVQGGKRRVSG